MVEEGKEIKDLKTLAKVKGVEEMIPKPASNQISKGGAARIWEEQYKIIEECLQMDGTIEEACILAWISVPSYYHHRDVNPDFARRMDMARQFPKLIARAAVQRRIRQWDAKTALEFLKLRDKKRYNPIPWVDEDWGIVQAERVQFISVPSNEWADQTKNDSQTHIKLSSASDISASSSEKQTPRENEDQALKNIDSLTFNIE